MEHTAIVEAATRSWVAGCPANLSWQAVLSV